MNGDGSNSGVSSKRSLSPADETQDEAAKRPKIDETGAEVSPSDESPDESMTSDAPATEEEDEVTAALSSAPTRHSNARSGIQRSIAMVLKHDGFDTATPGAMESFTALVEAYVESLIEETKRFALSARRDYPIPTDMEAVLRQFNLPVSSLKPHLKNPVRQETLAPSYTNAAVPDEDAYTTLPLLGAELSGQPDKDARIYIPSSFPEFPSRHTYKFTPQEDTNTRDPKKIREEAARTAQHGEDALRRLVRASKMRKQKEAKSLVEKDVQGKERFRLWESTMKRFMGADGRGENTDQVEIADHSMIVNGDAMFSRKEVSRLGKRSGPLKTNGH